jgi:hypothetical protein
LVIQSSSRASTYYWEFLKRFGEEGYRTWRAEIFTGVVITGVIYLISWRDKTAREAALIAVEASLIVFAGFVIIQLFRTPFLLHRERVHPASGDQTVVHWRYGILGVALLLALSAVVSYRITKPWLFPMQNISLNAPPPPAITQTPPSQPTESSRGKNPSKSLQQSASQQSAISTSPVQTAAPSTQTQAQPTQAAAPQTPLEKLTQTNRNLPPVERNQVAETFIDYAKFLEEGSALFYKANAEGGQIQHDWQDGSIAKDFVVHITKLREIDASASAYSQAFIQIRNKWKYYPDQTDYVFGYNADNLGPNTLMNAVEEYATHLDRWGKIQNKDQRDVLNLLGNEQRNFNESLDHFIQWVHGCQSRLEQMKKSIQ